MFFIFFSRGIIVKLSEEFLFIGVNALNIYNNIYKKVRTEEKIPISFIHVLSVSSSILPSRGTMLIGFDVIIPEK